MKRIPAAGLVILLFVLVLLGAILMDVREPYPDLPDIQPFRENFMSYEIREIDHDLSPSVPDRVYRPDQLDLDEISKGDILFSFDRVRSSTILILSEPYYLDGECMFDSVSWEDGKPSTEYIHTEYCSDDGLVEYTPPASGWNQSNYLTPSGEASLTGAEVKNILTQLRPKP